MFVALPALFLIGPGADPRGSGGERRQGWSATPTPSPTAGRGPPCRRASGGRRCSWSPSPRSTSSSFCWPGTAACTGWSRRASADRRAIRRCNRNSRRGASVPRAGRLRGHATSAKARRGVRAREDGRRAAARGGRGQFLFEANPARRQDAAGRPGADLQELSRPGRTIGDRIRVIREYADDEANTETIDRAADAHGRRRRHRRRASTATPSPAFASSTWRPMPSGRRSRTSR